MTARRGRAAQVALPDGELHIAHAHRLEKVSPMRPMLRAIAAAAFVLSAIIAAQAADYPVRPVTLVVPYPPGGGVDAMARIIAQKLGETFNQTFIVDNRGGAGGTIGTRL